MAYTTRREGCPLGEIETWIFDLDNTLYPGLVPAVRPGPARMNEFIARPARADAGSGAELQQDLFPRARHDDARADDGQPDRPARFSRLCARDRPRLRAARPGSRRGVERAARPQDRPHQRLGSATPSGCSTISGIAGSFCGIIDIAAAEFRPETGARRLPLLAAAARGRAAAPR